MRRNYELKIDEITRRNDQLMQENSELHKQVQEGVAVMARALHDMEDDEE